MIRKRKAIEIPPDDDSVAEKSAAPMFAFVPSPFSGSGVRLTQVGVDANGNPIMAAIPPRLD
jgi:hypothetical protein